MISFSDTQLIKWSDSRFLRYPSPSSDKTFLKSHSSKVIEDKDDEQLFKNDNESNMSISICLNEIVKSRDCELTKRAISVERHLSLTVINCKVKDLIEVEKSGK